MLLLGEYAVLEGCPAISLAVNRRAVVKVSQTGAAKHTLKSTLNPGQTLEFSVRNDELLWSDQASAAKMGLDGLLGSWLDVFGDINAPALHIDLDTSAFYHDGEGQALKLGLGSSAALSVACTGAFSKLKGETPGLPGLIARHRASQGGSGSGIDVTTAINGGVIRFQRMNMTEDPSVQKLALPADFYYAAVWTGESAPTGSMLGELKRWTSRYPDRWQMCLLAARVICDAACRAILNSDSTALVRTIKGYGEWLKALDKASGLRIYTPAHSFLDTMATESGCSYKSSGAGGGDIGIVVATSTEKLTDFQNSARAEDYHLLSLETDQDGLQVDR